MRVFEVLKLTAGCIFRCEAAKVKLAKHIEKWIFKEKLVCIMQYFIKYFENFSNSVWVNISYIIYKKIARMIWVFPY